MVISADEVIQLAGSREVEISGFEEGIDITVRLKRVSLLNVAGSGKIPNSLMPVVMQLFDGKPKQEGNEIDPKDMGQVLNLFCAESLVEPTYDEIGDLLTDVQRTEIFNYAQKGLKALEKFRKKPVNTINNINGEAIQETT